MPKNALAKKPSNMLGQGLAPYGMRYAGESGLDELVLPKGKGFMGKIPNKIGQDMTELSSAFEYNGKLVPHPLVVPTLLPEELAMLKNLKEDEQIPEGIYRKAQDYARMRLEQGLSPFADSSELRYPQPK
jgi:hypothetical protein